MASVSMCGLKQFKATIPALNYGPKDTLHQMTGRSGGRLEMMVLNHAICISLVKTIFRSILSFGLL